MRITDINEDEDYRGEHQPQGADGGAPLFDLTINGIYPNDVYESNGARYYDDGLLDFRNCYYIAMAYHNRPNKPIKIYRAVPKKDTNEDLINRYAKQKAYILKYGKLPPDADTHRMNASEYYEYIWNKIHELEALPPSPTEAKITINPGDWVTISKKYAADHGKSNLQNKYRILSKTVAARDIFTSGESLHEWGYDPQPVVPVKRTKKMTEGAKYPVKQVDEYGKNIVFDNGQYRVVVNKPDNATYVTVWKLKKDKWTKIGEFYTHELDYTYDGEKGTYLTVESIDLDKADRGLGIGKLMYKVMLDHAAPHIKGIISYLPNRSNKRQVPKIYKSMGAVNDGDYQIIFKGSI